MHRASDDILLLLADRKKRNRLPLFGHFCCRLAIQPDCINREFCSEKLLINGEFRWARLRGFAFEIWPSKLHAQENERNSASFIQLNKNATLRWLNSKNTEFQVSSTGDDDVDEGHDDETRKDRRLTTICFGSVEDARTWYNYISALLAEHTEWQHAVVAVQNVAVLSSDAACISPIQKNWHLTSLYDRTLVLDDDCRLSDEPREPLERFKPRTSVGARLRQRSDVSLSSEFSSRRRRFAGFSLGAARSICEKRRNE